MIFVGDKIICRINMLLKKLSTLEELELTNAFIAYFKPWALTPSCIKILNKISTKIVEIKYEDNLKIYFKNEDEDKVAITFGASYKGDFHNNSFTIPKSYKTVVQMHNPYYLKMTYPIT
ncbi:hypothetical protein CXF68_05250 [Tenacibaculum sp. Bg11-29]|nr:hypothetical protein CXF68_05250 [Tenacibaculum sp. Bg11-29]